MDDQPAAADPTAADRFAWHPTYGGRSTAVARAAILAEIESDQRAHALALEGAERYESDALATIVQLERKWGPFDLDWAEADAGMLADRVLDFEQERERRRELFPYREVRERSAPPVVPAPPDGRAPFRVGPPLIGAAIIVLALLVLALLLLR